MNCPYCENPLRYGLLPARMIASRVFRQDGPPQRDASGEVILINGKPWPSMMEHEVQKLIHPELVPVTTYNGILCQSV